MMIASSPSPSASATQARIFAAAEAWERSVLPNRFAAAFAGRATDPRLWIWLALLAILVAAWLGARGGRLTRSLRRLIERKLGKVEKALDKAIELLEFLSVYAIDRDPAVYDRLAAIYLRQQNWKDAGRVLDKGARIFPTNVAIFKRQQELETRE